MQFGNLRIHQVKCTKNTIREKLTDTILLFQYVLRPNLYASPCTLRFQQKENFGINYSKCPVKITTLIWSTCNYIWCKLLCQFITLNLLNYNGLVHHPFLQLSANKVGYSKMRNESLTAKQFYINKISIVHRKIFYKLKYFDVSGSCEWFWIIATTVMYWMVAMWSSGERVGLVI